MKVPDELAKVGRIHQQPKCTILRAEAEHLPLEDRSVDLVFGSPPYPEKGERYAGKRRRWESRAWAEWMVRVTQECLRVCKGPVCWVVNGARRQERYLPAVEHLTVALDLTDVHLERPCIWHKNAPPSSAGAFGLGNDWEPIVIAKHPGAVPYFDWEAIAAPPKYKAGGRFRQRDTRGNRKLGSEYPQTKLARPRDVFRVTVGGGHLGSPLAHENEAPFPEKLVEPFVKLLCPPGGTVLDPFSGSGTTAKVALQHGRSAIASDIRETQCELTRRRIAEVQTTFEVVHESP